MLIYFSKISVIQKNIQNEILSKFKFYCLGLTKFLIIDSDCRKPHMTKHMINKPIQLEISLKSSWRYLQLECKTESPRIATTALKT